MIRLHSCFVYLALSLALSGCGSDSESKGGTGSAGNISGSVQATDWSKLASAYWIGKPSPGSSPVIIFLFESAIDCSTLTSPNWDKVALGDAQLLEITLKDQAIHAYQVNTDASVAYLKGFYNPDADNGNVTLIEVNPTKNIKGSFDVSFAADALKGSFDAKYCADGVEP